MLGTPWPCPICGTPVVPDYDIMDLGTIMEEDASCKYCNLYSYQYATGYSWLCVGLFHWEWSYTDKGPNRRLVKFAYSLTRSVPTFSRGSIIILILIRTLQFRMKRFVRNVGRRLSLFCNSALRGGSKALPSRSSKKQ